MFVVTADQIDSREHEDAAGATRDRINDQYGTTLLLPADRNAGDEIQMLATAGATALALALDLTRTRQWSVGLGCGTVRLPLPDATREASGPAFFAARDAVSRAKKRQTRFALHAFDPEIDSASARNAEALVDLLLVIRDRRTEPGWELFDLLASGLTQQDAAARLAISPPAASSRAHAANIRSELAAIPALTKLLDDLDSLATGTDARA